MKKIIITIIDAKYQNIIKKKFFFGENCAITLKHLLEIINGHTLKLNLLYFYFAADSNTSGEKETEKNLGKINLELECLKILKIFPSRVIYAFGNN